MRLPVLSLAFVASIAFAFPAVARSGETVPLISTTQIHRVDVVSAKDGKKEIGSIAYAYRKGDVVYYFASPDHCGQYAQEPKKYPDADKAVRVAFMGADPVARFPDGVKSPIIGSVVNGDPTLSARYDGATYWFSTKHNRDAFLAASAHYVPPVGGYCLGAMGSGRTVPGDPRFAFYLPEVHTWAVFGSMNGPLRFAKMTSKERADAYWTAVWYYKHLTRHSEAVAQK